MDTTITTLIEDRPGSDSRLKTEHGVSFLIERDDTTVLFDTGQSGLFLSNAGHLGKDLATVDHVVISHGHYDHTDGFPYLVDAIPAKYTLHVHRDLFHPKYAAENGNLRYIGPSWDEGWARMQGFPVEPVSGNGCTIAPGIHIVTGFERTHPLEVANPRFVVHRPGTVGTEIDDFHDEVSLVIEVDGGIVVLVGCSHPGIMNMISTITTRYNAPILAILGGTHLIEAKGERLDEAVTFLSENETIRLGLSHCTGDEAMSRLEKAAQRFYRNNTGSVLSLP
ncbi:MAG: MBL fold metallo-hydrolase [Alkalispirochaeta sp.]